MTNAQLTTGIAVVVAIAVVGYFFIYGNPFMNQQNPLDVGLNAASSPAGEALAMQDEVLGSGAVASPGDMLTVNYTGKLADGTVFDTSVGKAPFQFTLGAGQVIAGWDQGLMGMKVGGKRLLVIPPALAYGANDYGPIPGNSTLTFEVELLKVTPASNVAPNPEGQSAQ